MERKIIWFASENVNKIKEIEKLFAPYNYQVKSLNDLANPISIVEDGATFVENAIIKATKLYQLVREPVIADDSGLEIEALNNFPGIHSARWKGAMSYEQAMAKILNQMDGEEDRRARFISAIAYVDERHNIIQAFQGQLEGEIATSIKGTNTFGYDQIFYVKSINATLGEITADKKNTFSHRYKAFKELIEWLKLEKVEAA